MSLQVQAVCSCHGPAPLSPADLLTFGGQCKVPAVTCWPEMPRGVTRVYVGLCIVGGCRVHTRGAPCTHPFALACACVNGCVSCTWRFIITFVHVYVCLPKWYCCYGCCLFAAMICYGNDRGTRMYTSQYRDDLCEGTIPRINTKELLTSGYLMASTYANFWISFYHFYLRQPPGILSLLLKPTSGCPISSIHANC